MKKPKKKCWHQWKRVLPFETGEWAWECQRCYILRRYATIDARNWKGRKP